MTSQTLDTGTPDLLATLDAGVLTLTLNRPDARNAMSRSHALRLWLRHVSDAERASRNLPRHVLAWSDFIADWRGQVERMSRDLGVAFDRSPKAEARVDDFLSAELKRQNADERVAVATGDQDVASLAQPRGDRGAEIRVKVGDARNRISASYTRIRFGNANGPGDLHPDLA